MVVRLVFGDYVYCLMMGGCFYYVGNLLCFEFLDYFGSLFAYWVSLLIWFGCVCGSRYVLL